MALPCAGAVAADGSPLVWGAGGLVRLCLGAAWCPPRDCVSHWSCFLLRSALRNRMACCAWNVMSRGSGGDEDRLSWKPLSHRLCFSQPSNWPRRSVPPGPSLHPAKAFTKNHYRSGVPICASQLTLLRGGCYQSSGSVFSVCPQDVPFPRLSVLCAAVGLWKSGAVHHEVPARVRSPLHLCWGDRRSHLQSQRD